MNIKPRMIGVLLVATLSGWTHAAVFGDDDRRKLTPEEPTYAVREALGRLTCKHPETGQKLVGTAAIVDTGTAEDGHEILLTAAHVVMDPATGKPLEDCRFKSEGRFWGSDPVVGMRTGQFDGLPASNPEDWAVVIISVNQPAKRRLLVWPHETTAEPVALVGYRGDRTGLWVSDNCFARAPRRDEALYNVRVWLSDCDASPGSSGAPLVIKQGHEWYWGGLYRGHLYDATQHQKIPNWQPTFSGQSRMNVIVRMPTGRE